MKIATTSRQASWIRAQWPANPTANWSFQASWADITSPEAPEPDEDEERWSVSGIKAAAAPQFGLVVSDDGIRQRERSDGVSLDAWLAEAAWHPNDNWTLFARGEAIETDELGAVHHGPVEDVSRLSVGAIRDWRINEHAVFGVGALCAATFRLRRAGTAL